VVARLSILLTASLLVLFMAAPAAEGRSWMDKQGRTIEAEVVRVNPDRTVVMKTDRGKIVTVPFDTFSEMDVEHLEFLFSRRGRGKPHPVPWYEMNDLFGLELWQDDLLWDDPTAAAAKRIEIKKESRTDFMENYRAYPLGKKKVLSEPVYATALYGGTKHVESLSFVFLNLGDMPRGPVVSHIENSGMRVRDVLAQKLGKPKRDSLGSGDLREKVWRWDWNGHAIMLSHQEGKYVAMRIMPVQRAERGGRIEKVSDDELRERIASCVERRDNGDVIVRNVPMVDQGPKGYCSPATWERYLRYLDIPADMYLLALAANTGAGGGTYSPHMIEATKNIISSNGRKLKDIDSKPTLDNIAKYIDMGLPIMWRFRSTPSFQLAANNCTAIRNGKEPKEQKSGQAEDSSAGGHICLIIGYNEQTGEIAISDSWGPEYAERWVPVNEARGVSYGDMNVIKW